MNSKVKVVALDETGLVINQSKSNPEYGYVRVEQTRTMVDDNGFLRRKNVSTLIHGTMDELSATNFYAGQELPGAIVIKESLEPFNAKNPERDLKIAGETGIICKVGDSPIYRKTVYTPASNVQDELIQHDNVAELRAAYETSSSSAMTANTDFDNVG
jgi:hypothetical protein